MKPPAMARGCGIKVSLCGGNNDPPYQVVNKWSQIPKTRPLVVQRYVARPYLINGDNLIGFIGLYAAWSMVVLHVLLSCFNLDV